MDEQKPRLQFSGATLLGAFEALESHLLITNEGPASLPEGRESTLRFGLKSNSKDSFQGELPSIAERIRLEVALLEKEEMRGEASKSLAELAECPECSMTHAQAIVAILECKNSEWGGAISSQVRRAKKALEALSRKPSSMNSSNYPDGKKRDTLPYPKKPAAGAGQSECMAIKAPANGKQSSH